MGTLFSDKPMWKMTINHGMGPGGSHNNFQVANPLLLAAKHPPLCPAIATYHDQFIANAAGLGIPKSLLFSIHLHP